MEYTLLSHLSMQCQNYKIRVRICRVWESTAPFLKGDIFSLDCLLIDEMGYSMQATIRKQDAEDFKCQLAEGKAYIIEKFNVIPSKKRFIAIDRSYMIQISKWTTITPLEDNIDSIPLYSFNFSSFSEIERKRNNDNVLTDVIGQIVSVGEAAQRYVQQTLTFIKKIKIEDFEENHLLVTLWDKFASYFEDDDFNEKKSKGPIIVILAGMTVRTFQEKIQLSTCSASKIYLNLEIPDVSTFRNRLHPMVKQIEWIAADNQQVISPQEEMCLNRKTIDELLSIDSLNGQNTKFTCEATIIDIDTSYGWWYKSCYNCRAAVKTYDDTTRCQHCGKDDKSPIPWYKLNTVVEDKTGIACFTIFGTLAQELVRFPAQYLATMAVSDKFSLPPIIKAIIGHKHIFQVVTDLQQFRTSLTSFKVTKIFTLNYSTKGKTLAKETLLLKSEEEFNPLVETSSSSNLSVKTPAKNLQSSDPPTEKMSEKTESPPAKRHCVSESTGSSKHKQ